MTANITATVNDTMNRVAVEVGLDPQQDPWGSTDPDFRRLKFMVNIVGEELCRLYPWEFLVREHQIQTLDTDTGEYPLPSDFLYMINQTGWERAENVPLFGPLSAQDWQYLLGRDLVSYTIYASFRIQQGVFTLFPQPPPNGLDIHFEYIARAWCIDSNAGGSLSDEAKAGSDTPLFDRTLFSRMLKVKWLEAKGYDSSKAQDDVNQMFGTITGQDKGAPVLAAGNNFRQFPYLDGWRNTPDTGYGT